MEWTFAILGGLALVWLFSKASPTQRGLVGLVVLAALAGILTFLFNTDEG
jgi:hypothetical protein